jgi:hypothetical protein
VRRASCESSASQTVSNVKLGVVVITRVRSRSQKNNTLTFAQNRTHNLHGGETCQFEGDNDSYRNKLVYIRIKTAAHNR